VLETCAIITTAANELMAPIHERMPVILPQDAIGDWLDATTRQVELAGLLRPCAPEMLEAYTVSNLVNRQSSLYSPNLNEGRHTMLTCEQSPPGQMLLAIRQFNNREWYDCHETIEELWLGESGEMKDFLQGVLQIAVALHHWRNGNHGGAVSLLVSGSNYLKRVSDVCLWVDVPALIADAEKVRIALEELGKERITELDPTLILRIKTVSAALHSNTSEN
jgi:hypothetical protein